MTLPEGWAKATISDVAMINPKHASDTDRKRLVSFVPMPAVDENLGRIIDHANRALGEVWTGYTHFADGDVIFAKITPCMENGKAAVARGLTGGMACGSTEFYVLRPTEGVVAEYLWRFLRQPSFRAAAETQMTGAVGQRRVPRDYLENHTFPLASEAEQRRIVAKLDTLTNGVNRARIELNQAIILTKKLREAALRKAFEGSSQRHTILGDLLEDVRYGTAQKCNYGGGESPVLRIPNVQAGKIDLSDLKSATFDAKEIAKLRLQRGDLLVIRSNGSLELVGRSAVIEQNGEGMLYAGYLIRLRPTTSRALPKYLHYFLGSPTAREILLKGARSTSGVNNINSQQLQALPVPLMSVEEQAGVVTRLEAIFAHADRLETEAARGLALIDRFEAAVLTKAFRGELVPQNPNDEPAGLLLDRIRDRRANATKPKRSRRVIKAHIAQTSTRKHR